MNNRSTLVQLFRSVLLIPLSNHVSSFEYGKTKGWDSVAHMQLVTEIESTFGVMLDTDAVIRMSSFTEAVKILAELGIAFDEDVPA